ncbi:MAG: transposase [Clostridiales bacterium]|nr:transposase [Clostridiales bacterium]
MEKNLAKLVEKAAAAFKRLGIGGEASTGSLGSAIGGMKAKMAELGVVPAHGRGSRKTQLQRDCEELEGILERWLKYESQLLTMGPGCNSYSKTDPDATFMRMKDDHMRNGQLKPGYNVQICVNSEFITGIGVYAGRSDVNTFEPFVSALAEKHGQKYEAASADAGYESLANYRFLDSEGIASFIKPANYEHAKTRKFKNQIGRRENMAYDEAGDCCVCASGRRLVFDREHAFAPKNGGRQVNKVCRCEGFGGCAHRQKCCKSKDVDMPKEIEANLEFIASRDASLSNIASQYGIKLRVNRSIQVEGVFGVIKEDHCFRRFL